MRTTQIQSALGSSTRNAFDHFRESLPDKIIRKLMPLMFLMYFVNQVDRVNISFASLTMNKDLGLTPEMYGFGAGIFFIGYILFEIPSNLVMHRVGARVWMFRIMLTWGLVSTAMAWAYSPTSFYVLRFMLGVAEAGFVPGMFLYMSYWIPAANLGRAMGMFNVAGPLTVVLAGPLSTALLQLHGSFGLTGWQWVFLIEGLPAVLLAFVALRKLPDRPEQAAWLEPAEQDWLRREIAQQDATASTTKKQGLLHGLTSPAVLLLCAIYVSLVVGLYGIAFWLPQIVRGFGFSNLQTGFVIAVPYLLGAIACYLWPRHSDGKTERRWHFAIPCFVAATGLVISAIVGPTWYSLIPITFGVIGIWAAVPVFWCVPARHLAGLAAAAGMALINSVGNFGGFAGPYLVGWLRQTTGSFTAALVVLAVGPLLAGVLALCMPEEPAEVLAGRPEHA